MIEKRLWLFYAWYYRYSGEFGCLYRDSWKIRIPATGICCVVFNKWFLCSFCRTLKRGLNIISAHFFRSAVGLLLAGGNCFYFRHCGKVPAYMFFPLFRCIRYGQFSSIVFLKERTHIIQWLASSCPWCISYFNPQVKSGSIKWCRMVILAILFIMGLFRHT